MHGNIKLQVFPKLKLYVESPKVMVNKCVVRTIVIRKGKIVWKHGPHVAEF